MPLLFKNGNSMSSMVNGVLHVFEGTLNNFAEKISGLTEANIFK